jgi:hypothetical protein
MCITGGIKKISGTVPWGTTQAAIAIRLNAKTKTKNTI